MCLSLVAHIKARRSITTGSSKSVSSEPAKTVAIIDDDPNIRCPIKCVLSSFGYIPRAYDCAEAFLAVAAASRPDCLLVDIELGNMSGVEMGRQLAAFGLRLPIIFMSGLADQSIQRQASELGCIAYLQKPFDEEQLIEAIVKAIGGPTRAEVDLRRPI